MEKVCLVKLEKKSLVLTSAKFRRAKAPYIHIYLSAGHTKIVSSRTDQPTDHVGKAWKPHYRYGAAPLPLCKFKTELH